MKKLSGGCGIRNKKRYILIHSAFGNVDDEYFFLIGILDFSLPTGKLIKRKNKKTGQCFLGCTNYPKCSYTQKIKPEETNIPDAASVWE